MTPLLNVQRTEEELTAKIQELENLKATLEKVEADRNHLKLENEKLEAKVSEIDHFIERLSIYWYKSNGLRDKQQSLSYSTVHTNI